jgi:hypothetical protein
MVRSKRPFASKFTASCNAGVSIIVALEKLLFRAVLFGFSVYGLVHFLLGR